MARNDARECRRSDERESARPAAPPKTKLKVFFAPLHMWAVCEAGHKPRLVRLRRIECPVDVVSDGARGWLECVGTLRREGSAGWVIR